MTQRILVAENPPEVVYVRHCGTDLDVVNSARVSFDTVSEVLSARDEKLINYLAEHQHMSPFEHVSLTVQISCPIYIAAQIMRHRTFSYNMVSRRYTSENLSFYTPIPREQNRLNKQSSGNKHSRAAYWHDKMNQLHKLCLQYYEEAIRDGLSRELARGMLPQNLNTKFIMTGNLRNYIHFISLRTHAGAQEEVRLIADQIKDILKIHYPVSVGALIKCQNPANSQNSGP